jgi:hypothetical protein
MPSQTPPLQVVFIPLGGYPQVPALQVAVRQSLGGVQFVWSMHCTHTPLPVQNGMPVGHALSVCIWPSAEHLRTMPFTQLTAPATHLSHSSAWLSQSPGPHCCNNMNADWSALHCSSLSPLQRFCIGEHAWIVQSPACALHGWSTAHVFTSSNPE